MGEQHFVAAYIINLQLSSIAGKHDSESVTVGREKVFSFPDTDTRLSYIWQIKLFKPARPQSPLHRLRQETWALFFSEVWVCLHYLCRTSPHVIFMSNHLSVFTYALLQLGNYSARIHQARIFMNFMRNYWDKTHTRIVNVHDSGVCTKTAACFNSLCDRALNHSGRKSCFSAQKMNAEVFFLHAQKGFFSLEVHSKVTTMAQPYKLWKLGD